MTVKVTDTIKGAPFILVYCWMHIQCHSLYGLFEELGDSQQFAMFHGSTYRLVWWCSEKGDCRIGEQQWKYLNSVCNHCFWYGVDTNMKGVHTVIQMGAFSGVNMSRKAEDVAKIQLNKTLWGTLSNRKEANVHLLSWRHTISSMTSLTFYKFMISLSSITEISNGEFNLKLFLK